MDSEVRDLLIQAIDAVYKDLKLEHYSFNEEEETYDIELFHKTSNKAIRIGFKDTGKRRDFDVIPLHAMNAPLALIEIFTTFLKVYWHAKDNEQTILESLSEMLKDEVTGLDLEDEEKLVH